MLFDCVFNLHDLRRLDVSLLIDSGSIASILSREFRHLVVNRQEKRHLLAVNGTPITVFGSISVTIHIDGRPYTHSFLVADVGCSILGYDFLSQNSITISTSPLRLISKYTPPSKTSSTLSKPSFLPFSASTSIRKTKSIGTSTVLLPIAAPRVKSLRNYKLIMKDASVNTDLQLATSSEVNPNTHLDPVLPLVNSFRSDNDRSISSSFESNSFSVPASNVDAPHNIASKFETTVKRLPDVNMSKMETGSTDQTISDSADDFDYLSSFYFFQSLLSHPDPFEHRVVL